MAFLFCIVGAQLLLSLASPSLAAYSCTASTDNPCQATCNGEGESFTLDISNIKDYPFEIDVDNNDDVDAQSFIYSCSGKDNDCNDETSTSVCMIGTGSDSKSCGIASAATWEVHKTCPDYLFSITYTGGECNGGLQCLSSVINFAQTDQSTTSIKFTRVAEGPTGANQYIFDVTGSSIGQPSCGSGGGSGSVVGIVGLVLILLALVALITYFVVGSLIIRYSRGATGKEMIPQVYFWTSLPGLVKDGCLFVISPCLRRSSDKNYDSL